ncbi:tyrosine-type recombinase/integrase [Protaetiibacter intestinalis]|uniref:Site-specific integrase n=1 Tax=Protaetiibacter intestinalis TaxID=2419774 RepID=A0A387B3K7_9MICO|nr:tyrosine-type recombinase/integrase [Protaetiibacter intestinalis]AYF97003.1 site-specific integrase [Protaetiibacter intestinalis]
MAHITEVGRKKGTAFEVHWRDADVKKMRTFRLRKEAEKFAARVELEKAEGRSTEPLISRGQTVAQVIEASLAASAQRLKPGTLAGYRTLYAAQIAPRFGAKRIAGVGSQEIEKWIADLVKAGLAPNTVHNYYVALNKLFRYALRHRLIAHNPCEAVELPKVTVREDFAPVFLTAAQVETIAAELDKTKPLGTLIRFAAYTGLRAAEIAGLRVRDVNLAAGHIEVRQTVKRLGREWVVGTPKSARSTRQVPLLNRALVTELRTVLLSNPNSGDPDALFWPGRANGSRRLDWTRPIDVGGVRQYYLVPAAQRLKIVGHMRMHDLRHTYASLMLAAGFKPYEVSRWMGHANVSTTDGIYGHLYPSDYTDQIARFEAFVADG